MNFWANDFLGFFVVFFAAQRYSRLFGSNRKLHSRNCVWPPIVRELIDSLGWQMTHGIIGLVCVVIMVPLALYLRGNPPAEPKREL